MTLTEQLAVLPAAPGVYLLKDKRGNVLYVGKAKVLRNRVRSYFSPSARTTEDRQPSAQLDPAKQQMVRRVATIDTISCDAEHEALILEANLIRQHQPPYNVVLTDDKYYLFIKITKEALPRVFPVRRLKSDGARYFGPYSSASAVRKTLKLLRRLFPHLTDSSEKTTWIFPHPLFSASGEKSATRKSLTAVSPAEQASYRENIRQIIRFLEGKRGEVIAILRSGMKTAAAAHEYERAALFRDQLQAIERLEGSQKVFLPRPESFDVVSVVSLKSQSAANVFAVRGGKLLQKNTFLLRHRHTTSLVDVVRQFLLQYYTVAQDIPPTILVPLALTDQAAVAHWINPKQPPQVVVPQRGKKRQLIAMGELNAQQLLTTEEHHFASEARLKHATRELSEALGLTATSLGRIETYDISNIQGSLATGSMVVFLDGLPARQHYRKFRIRLHDTPNDVAMLDEVLRRRLSNRHTDWPLPDLMIIDGGKGQLSVAKKVLDAVSLNIPLMALAKREEEIFLSGKSQPLRLPYNSDALYLLQRMRDEAHRFTIQYHRTLRSTQQKRSLLDEVPGIGPHTKKKLLARFGSLKAIRAATARELEDVIGKTKAVALRDYL